MAKHTAYGGDEEVNGEVQASICISFSLELVANKLKERDSNNESW